MEQNGAMKRSIAKENHSGNPTTNGKSRHTETARKILKSKKKLISLANFRYIVECVIASYILIPTVIFLLPFMLLYWVLKKLELWIVRLSYKSAVALNGDDALWQQDSDLNRMIISSVMFIERPKDGKKALQNFKQAIYERLVDHRDSHGNLTYPRAKQIIRPGIFQYFFVDDPNFNMDNHVFQYDGKPPKTKEELQCIISELHSTPLPENQSPWYYCFVSTQSEGNKDAIVFRIHHSMADGVSLSRFLTRVLTDQYIPQEEHKKFSSYERGFIFMKAVFIIGRTLLTQLLKFADNSIIHGAEMTGKKKCTWSEPIDLNLVKRIKNATGATVNDVLVACLTMAVRKYHKKHGVEFPPDFTAAIPVDISLSNTELKFQNKFAVVFIKLPASHEGALSILYETKSRIDATKTSGEPFAMHLLMSLSVEFLPEFVTKALLSFITRKATCVLSNVPGPQYFMSVSGNSIKHMTFWPPQRSNVGIGWSILSYAGQVTIGSQCDEAVMKDPEAITELFGESLEELTEHVLNYDN